ncbi:MAG TPA: C40 family peptidase [Gemmatimonadales bacterium]
MPSVIVLAAVAPVATQPSVRAEQCNQLVLGESASVVERQGDWVRVCTHRDDYDGWMHAGYLKLVETGVLDAWRSEAVGWSEGVVVRASGWQATLPLGARLALESEAVVLPDGRRGRIGSGSVRLLSEVISSARAKAPERWAAEYFLGSPYQWGGVTPWGVDCSGLVQTTFAARGIALPRDAAQQVTRGAVVSLDAVRPGDLLYFRSETGSGTITHVAFAGEADTLVHSTLACGGMVVESWLPGSRGATLRERLVAVRRLEER